MTLEVRRKSSTETIRHLWDAIVFIRQQRQVPNIERISNNLKKKHNISPDDLEAQLGFAVSDNLIEIKKSVACKGSRAGSEQIAYRIPENEMEKDGHDWYCFGCHKEGEVLHCSTCHRVYHKDCLKDGENISEEDKLICDICKLLKSKDALQIENEDLNLLLGYACLRLKEKVGNEAEILKLLPNEEKWRHNFLIYEDMDLTIMEDKTDNNLYNRIEEFQVDAQTMVHNIVLFCGVHSTTADLARKLLRDCCYDLGEIRQCPDCYKTSNEKREKHWFCKPCNPPHELVYAKQKSFPYWPAKVMRILNGKYDVRFFGGAHERANVEKEHIKPINTPLQQLQLKRSAALNKALEELKRHQQWMGLIPKKETAHHKAKKKSQPSSANSSRSNSRSRSRKGSVSSEDMSENEADDNSSQDECPSSSSPKIPRFKDVPTPEDHNVVSSSCQESPCAKVTVSTQTHKKLLASLLPPKPPKEPEVIPCDCEQKYGKMFKEFKERLEAEQKEEKERSLRELAERLRQDFEEEKQKVLAAAVEKIQFELSEAKQQSDEKIKSAHEGEITEIMERHKQEVSEIKKKQWCYNCELEAIYHCCWNTSYCSVDCQQVHWHKEHKRTCRRKR